MPNLLETLLLDFKEQFEVSTPAIFRLAQFSSMANKIKVAIGMRRTGKSYFLFQTIRRIMKEEKSPFERFLFLNFEDDRLAPCSQAQLVTLLDDFYKLYPENHDHTCYLFLDEIQNVEDWALVIRRLFDSKKLQIYLTGSSAKLLSKEIASSLRGRSMATEIWPFSFSEYLQAHKVQVKKGLLGKKIQDVLTKHLQEYIDEGGFPESIGLLPFERKQLLQDYVELVVMRDVVERHNISNITLIKYLIKTVLKNPGGNFSINKFANDIKSQGLLGVKNTILDYIRYLEDAYLIFFVPLFSESIKKTSMNPKKMYAIDTGLAKAFSFSFSDNWGHLFENMIYLDLRRQRSEVYYYLTQERYEVDFLAVDKLGKKCLFQVVWDVSNKETMERELRALESAKKELKLPGKLITPENYIEAIFKNKLEELLSA